ncbi:DNA gyrase inhibitor YacG [Anatilimnocola floriformis]|uniref:DNA gyrase inhibitor YacG n=1 Tax=Anatilimnocola floriformis TaxID=2948575 RepID=UPI0036F2C1E3
MSTLRCSICERYFDPATSDAMPFCSKRCKQVDLGRWLGERYSVPAERSEEDEDEGPSRHSSDGED